MPGEKTYKVGNDIFEIPEREVSNFLKDNPRAVEVNSFIVGKDTLDIPLSETDSFLKEVPDAQPLKKKDQKTPSPLPSPSSGSVSESTAGELVPTGINYLTGENFTAPAPQPLEIPQNQNPGLMAARTTAETTPKDQSQFSPEIQQGGAALGDKTESLMRGVARLGNSVLKTPGFLYDVATAVTNNVINKPFGLPYTPTAKQIGDMVPEEYNVVGQIDDAVASSQQKLRSKYDKDIADYFSNGEYSKGFDLLANSIVETAPTTIALMMGNAAGLTTAQSVLAGGAVFGADKMSELEKQNPDISQEQKVMVAAANGLLEGAFEQFGLTKLGDVTKEVLKKTGTEAAKKIAEEGFKKSYGKVLKQYLGTSAEEALSEAATQFAQNAVDKYSGANPDINLKDGVVDAAIIGLGAGASFSSPTTLLSIVKTKKALQQASKLADEKKALEEDIQSPDVPDAVKAAISEKIKSINEQEADIAAEEKEKFNNLTPEGQQQVDQLLKKSNDISSVITDENVSDETRESFKKDLDAIDKEIDKVYETAVKPQEPAADTAPADEDTEAEIAYLNELKNTFGLEDQELARLVELQSGRPQAQVPAAETTESTSDQETFQETQTLEQPAQESPEPQTINTEQNGQETNQTEAGKEADVLTPEEQPAVQDVQPEEQEPAPADTNTTSKNDLIDPEEEDDDVKDSPASKAALEKDIETMKQMKTQDLAEKKFIGMIERAWKAKEDGKISRKTYTAFRNTAKEILEGKVRAKDGVDATEAKLRSTAAINKVKDRLIGQGYKKITLSSLVPITPKNIDDLLTLTNKLIHRGIDAGFSIQEATQKALKAIKLNPAYKRLVGEGRDIDEKSFDDAVAGSVGSNEKSKKEASNENAGEQPSDISGPRRKKKTISRLENSDRLKEIASEMAEDDKFYTSISIPKASKHINDMLDSYQKEELLEDLAQKMIDGNSYFHPKITQWAAAKLSDRLRVIAEREGNEMQKSAINKLAAKLWSIRSNAVNIAATITGLESEIAKELPLSEEGLREVVNARIGGVRDTYFNNINKTDTETAIQSFQEIMESEEGQKAIREAVDAEINRIAEATKGKEWVQAVDKTLDGLKIDLTDC